MKTTPKTQFCLYCKQETCTTNCFLEVSKFRSTIPLLTLIREVWLEDLTNEIYEHLEPTNYLTFNPLVCVVEKIKSNPVVFDMEISHGNAVREKYPFLPTEIYQLLRELIFAKELY